MTIRKEERIGGQRLILGDCLDVMPLLGKFDAVVTDPPYGIGANKQTLGSGKREFHRGGNWDNSAPDVSVLFGASSIQIIWGGNYFAADIPANNDWLIWHKKNDNLSFSECEMAWTNLGKNVRHISHHWGGEVKLHPTQKPYRVMEWCIKHLPDTATTILDPFMGSGTTLVACQKLGRQGTGIEMDPDYFEIACKRVDEATRQPDLFVEPPAPKPTQEGLDL